MRDRRVAAPEQCSELSSVRAGLLRRAASFLGRQRLLRVGADPKHAISPLSLQFTQKGGRGCVARQGKQLRLVALEGADKPNHVLAHCGSQCRKFPVDPLHRCCRSALLAECIAGYSGKTLEREHFVHPGVPGARPCALRSAGCIKHNKKDFCISRFGQESNRATSLNRAQPGTCRFLNLEEHE
jgi:hypothetical protein